MPEHDNVDVRLEVAVSVRLVGLRPQVSPVNGVMVCESAMVPANPSRLVATTVEEPTDPARAVVVVGLAVRAKSSTV